MKNKKGLSNTQNAIVVTVTSIGMIGSYTGGVNLAKNNDIHHNQILIGTVVVTFISSYVLNSSTSYFLRKYNEKKENKRLKK